MEVKQQRGCYHRKTQSQGQTLQPAMLQPQVSWHISFFGVACSVCHTQGNLWRCPTSPWGLPSKHLCTLSFIKYVTSVMCRMKMCDYSRCKLRVATRKRTSDSHLNSYKLSDRKGTKLLGPYARAACPSFLQQANQHWPADPQWTDLHLLWVFFFRCSLTLQKCCLYVTC